MLHEPICIFVDTKISCSIIVGKKSKGETNKFLFN